jgi:hypothetical protein
MEMMARTMAAALIDEAAVDLEAVNFVLQQVGEAGEAGAKVVNRDLDAELAQVHQGFVGGGRVGHQGLLGDLDLKATRRQAGLAQGHGNLRGQVFLAELTRRKVDGDDQFTSQRVLQFLTLMAGGADGPFADGHDHAGGFGEGNEL